MAKLKTSSAKAKGRRLQQLVRDELRRLFPALDPTDVESRGMGQNGTDIILTKAAKDAIGDLAIECKNCEKLNVPKIFWDHSAKYPSALAWLVHSKNHSQPLITLKLSDFLKYAFKDGDVTAK